MIHLRQGSGVRVALVDYGAGNLTSVRKALAALGADVVTAHRPADLASVRGIIVPGVGHFGRTRALDEPWRTAIQDAVAGDAALLGICLGMQWLFEGSGEASDLPGLGIFQGACVHLATNPGGLTSPNLKVPHVGWNGIEQPRPTALMRGIEPHAQVYFTHSYVAPPVPETAALTTYGIPFTSAVERGRIAGVQFHPEKSGDVGLRVLRNWLGAV